MISSFKLSHSSSFVFSCNRSSLLQNLYSPLWNCFCIVISASPGFNLIWTGACQRFCMIFLHKIFWDFLHGYFGMLSCRKYFGILFFAWDMLVFFFAWDVLAYFSVWYILACLPILWCCHLWSSRDVIVSSESSK